MEPTENHPLVPTIWTHTAGDNITLVIWNEHWTIKLEYLQSYLENNQHN